MKFLSKQQAEAWLAKSGLDLREPTLKKHFSYRGAYVLPPDAGQKTHLARCMSRLADPAVEGLFWVTTWAVWPSGENMHLFSRYREALGETRTLTDTPAHIVNRNETPDLECLLDFCLYFLWDAYYVQDSGDLAFRLSHDEFAEILATSQKRLVDSCRLFEEMNLKKIQGRGEI